MGGKFGGFFMRLYVGINSTICVPGTRHPVLGTQYPVPGTRYSVLKFSKFSKFSKISIFQVFKSHDEHVARINAHGRIWKNPPGDFPGGFLISPGWKPPGHLAAMYRRKINMKKRENNVTEISFKISFNVIRGMTLHCFLN